MAGFGPNTAEVEAYLALLPTLTKTQWAAAATARGGGGTRRGPFGEWSAANSALRDAEYDPVRAAAKRAASIEVPIAGPEWPVGAAWGPEPPRDPARDAQRARNVQQATAWAQSWSPVWTPAFAAVEAAVPKAVLAARLSGAMPGPVHGEVSLEVLMAAKALTVRAIITDHHFALLTASMSAAGIEFDALLIPSGPNRPEQ